MCVTALVAGGIGLLGAGISAASARKAPSAPQLAPMPKKEEMKDFVDYLTGTEVRQVSNPLNPNMKMIVRKALPRSEERQAIFDEATSLFKTSLTNLKDMTQNFPSEQFDVSPYVKEFSNLIGEKADLMARLIDVPDFDQYAKDYSDMARTASEEAHSQSAYRLRERMTKSGYGSSTALDSEMSLLERGQRGEQAKLQLEAPKFAAEMRGKAISNEGSLVREMASLQDGRMSSLEKKMRLEKESFDGVKNTHLEKMKLQEGLYSKGKEILTYDDNIRLNGASPQIPLQEQEMMNRQNLDYMRAANDGSTQQYQNQSSAYSNQPPSFGETLGNTMSAGGGYVIGRGANKQIDKWMA